MNILYIGQYTEGTTSKMRADQLKKILQPKTFNVINTHIPFHQSHKIWRSIGFRYKRGPLIKKVNQYILQAIKEMGMGNNQFAPKLSPGEEQNHSKSGRHFNLIWIDKAIFLTPETTKYLKRLSYQLIHFTPDPAFTFHKSQLFRSSLSLYDYAITTKAYELEYFKKYLKSEQIIYATQGYDKNIHRPLTTFSKKKAGVLFIGHHEHERAKMVQLLLSANIPVAIAGIKWESFVKKNHNNPFLHYMGKGIYGEEYVKTISNYQLSWGSISKWIPEKHTTRTFEIPACGTALVTERNAETRNFYKEDEVVFYDNPEEMIDKIHFYLTHPKELEELTKRGTERILMDGRDYESILNQILKKIGILGK